MSKINPSHLFLLVMVIAGFNNLFCGYIQWIRIVISAILLCLACYLAFFRKNKLPSPPP